MRALRARGSSPTVTNAHGRFVATFEEGFHWIITIFAAGVAVRPPRVARSPRAAAARPRRQAARGLPRLVHVVRGQPRRAAAKRKRQAQSAARLSITAVRTPCIMRSFVAAAGPAKRSCVLHGALATT